MYPRIGTSYVSSDLYTTRCLLGHVCSRSGPFAHNTVRKHLIIRIKPFRLVLGSITMDGPLGLGLLKCIDAIVGNPFWEDFFCRHDTPQTVRVTEFASTDRCKDLNFGTEGPPHSGLVSAWFSK